MIICGSQQILVELLRQGEWEGWAYTRHGDKRVYAKYEYTCV